MFLDHSIRPLPPFPTCNGETVEGKQILLGQEEATQIDQAGQQGKGEWALGSFPFHGILQAPTAAPVGLAPLDVANSVVVGLEAVERVEFERAIRLANSLQQGLVQEVPQCHSA